MEVTVFLDVTRTGTKRLRSLSGSHSSGYEQSYAISFGVDEGRSIPWETPLSRIPLKMTRIIRKGGGLSAGYYTAGD